MTVFRAVEDIAEGTEGAIIVSDFASGGQLIVAGTEEQEDLPTGAITTEEELNQVLGNTVAAGPISRELGPHHLAVDRDHRRRHPAGGEDPLRKAGDRDLHGQRARCQWVRQPW